LTGLSNDYTSESKDMESLEVATRLRKLSRRNIIHLLYLLSLTIYAFSSTACISSDNSGKSTQRTVETVSTPHTSASASPVATEEPSPDASSKLPPPEPEEVRGAVARVYKDAVTIDTSNPPGYVVGDFNNDGSEDIAVVVRPVKGKLEEINSEVANWIMEDPRKVVLPDPHKSVQPLPPRPAPVKVEQDDVLLTIIHGYKQEGWRNREAQQAYMLYDAVGSSMTAQPLKTLQGAIRNKNPSAKSGDVIKETLAGEQGFLYWTGAKYAWHRR
jgi:hypothetical protein